MTHLRRKLSIYCIIVALLLLQLGCAWSGELPPPPSEELRAHLGTIGVVSVQFMPEVEILTPAKGWVRGGARGALDYTEKLLDMVTPQGGAIACVLSPFSALAGFIAGAREARPAAEVEMTEEKFNKYVYASIEIQEEMKAQFLQVAEEQTRYAFVVLEGQGPATPDEKLSYDSLADHNIDTVIEIGVLNFGLKGPRLEINPLLKFFMTLRTRLIRIADGKVVYDATLRYEDVTYHEFDVWAANEARLFKEEFGPCYPILAEKIVGEVFLLYLPS
jgi:hypothetical protein